MMDTISRTCIRARPVFESYPHHHHQQLFVRVRNLLKANQAHQASQLFINELSQHLPKPGQATGEAAKGRDDWLWKTTILFRSYNHPELALHTFNHLKSLHLPVPIKAAVSAFQASSDLVWNYPNDNPHRVQQEMLGNTQTGYDDQHLHHTHLAKSLLELTNLHQQQQQQHHIPQKSALKNQHENLDEVRGYNQRVLETPSTSVNLSDQNTRVLEVIMANILKLGDMDWIVSIFRDFYPRYTEQLGLYLYPDSSSPSETRKIKPMSPDQAVPSGRLVKFLVTGYTVCKDLRRAFFVVKFHRAIMEDRQRSSDSTGTDLTPEITFLREISRSTIGSQEMRMRMVTDILKHLSRKQSVNELDSYAIDGLLEMRYRLAREGWNLRRHQQATFDVISTTINCSLNLFLLHRAHPPTFPINQSSTTLIHGQRQGQHIISSWKYRPTAKTFTISILSLRSLLRFQTRSIIIPNRHPSLSNHNRYQDWGDLEEGISIEKRPKKRRASPGPHRTILSQIIAFENLNQLVCGSVSTLPLSPNNNLQGDTINYKRQETQRCLPIRFELLTSKNLKLLVECLLLARDYVSVWILLLFLMKSRSAMSITELDEMTEQIKTVKNRLEDLNPDLSTSWPLSQTPSSLTKDLSTEKYNFLLKWEGLLRTCFKLDFNALSNHSSLSWENEAVIVCKKIDREHSKLNNQFFNSTALSEFTLSFLRKEIGRGQLDVLSYGINDDTA
ncbi:hypothetical protein MJO28_013848 [Puccinia striiformis f. sp. tritici]|uniref:Uncharacterized protein n=1 Tax=Puccinia striiformis f. sp. tritici TaxID=168172 RepID=A0ACC0DVT7_9BASI|nr:hypothetical protein MJO28_013848 [Puccinia striiformis f. sp. tritici]KAI7946199.1 hypothetical protein MJO29_010726 [Puccinia striiformis f. sp. tritici]